MTRTEKDMKREIKFRAMLSDQYVKQMSKPDKIWNYSGNFSMSDKFSSNEMRGMPEFFDVMNLGQLDRSTLSQFTGLKDKNGKEIYEGDIFEGGSVVEWNLDGWKAKVNTPKGLRWYTVYKKQDEFENDVLTNREIIGNIYENPELLTPSMKEEKSIKS